MSNSVVAVYAVNPRQLRPASHYFLRRLTRHPLQDSLDCTQGHAAKRDPFLIPPSPFLRPNELQELFNHPQQLARFQPARLEVLVEDFAPLPEAFEDEVGMRSDLFFRAGLVDSKVFGDIVQELEHDFEDQQAVGSREGLDDDHVDILGQLGARPAKSVGLDQA